MKKLRLLFTEKCNRSCPGCCNKEWDLKSLPKCERCDGFDEILITGGEPLLIFSELLDLVWNIRRESKAKIFLYTAVLDSYRINRILRVVDGITLTLHEEKDLIYFKILEHNLFEFRNKSMRLNAFRNVGLKSCLPYWDLKNNMEWIKHCPLPQDEVFMRV